VKVKGLNDAKHIAIVVCFVTVAMFTTVVLTSTLSSNNITTYIVIYGIGIWICATIILVIMFVPKVSWMRNGMM
jgi:amino acid transporter